MQRNEQTGVRGGGVEETQEQGGAGQEKHRNFLLQCSHLTEDECAHWETTEAATDEG